MHTDLPVTANYRRIHGLGEETTADKLSTVYTTVHEMETGGVEKAASCYGWVCDERC